MRLSFAKLAIGINMTAWNYLGSQELIFLFSGVTFLLPTPRVALICPGSWWEVPPGGGCYHWKPFSDPTHHPLWISTFLLKNLSKATVHLLKREARPAAPRWHPLRNKPGLTSFLCQRVFSSLPERVWKMLTRCDWTLTLGINAKIGKGNFD